MARRPPAELGEAIIVAAISPSTFSFRSSSSAFSCSLGKTVDCPTSKQLASMKTFDFRLFVFVEIHFFNVRNRCIDFKTGKSFMNKRPVSQSGPNWTPMH